MKILDLYIARTILSSIALVTLMLLGIQLFILFVDQLDSIGRGHYNVWKALGYVAYQMPNQLYLFFPVSCLLGSLVGLGMLASNNELVVVRAAGMSIGQVIVSVFKVAIVLILLVSVLGELLIPKLMHKAEIYKAVARSGGQALTTMHGVWLRDESSLIHVGTVESDKRLRDISQYRFDQGLELELARYAALASYENDHWILSDVVESAIQPDKVTVLNRDEIIWDVSISPGLLSLISVAPEAMTLVQLQRHINENRARQLQTAPYELTFWKRIMRPLSALVMMLLAIPFIFGPLRSVSASARIVVGAIVGFSFYMLDKFFGPVSFVYQLPPLAAAVIPTLLFALLSLYLLRRTR